MVTGEVVVCNDIGLHARPSLRISEIARRYGETKITVENPKNGGEADAKSILNLLALAVGGRETVVLSAEGKDEDKAFKEISEVIETYSVD